MWGVIAQGGVVLTAPAGGGGGGAWTCDHIISPCSGSSTAVGGCCLPRCVRIQRGACICGCYDWSHAPVLFAARRTGNRPVILILHYNRCRRIADSSTKDLSIRQIRLYIILFTCNKTCGTNLFLLPHSIYCSCWFANVTHRQPTVQEENYLQLVS